MEKTLKRNRQESFSDKIYRLRGIILVICVPLLLISFVLFLMPHSSSVGTLVSSTQAEDVFVRRVFPSGRKSVGSNSYAVIFDAGSSGSRVHVYCFDQKLNLVPIGKELELFVQKKPGLSAYASDPIEAAESLKSLLDEAEHIIPEDLRRNTPVRVGATAGLRQLGVDASDRILQSVRDFLQEKSALKSKPDWVTVLDGTQEGAYQWESLDRTLAESKEKDDSVPLNSEELIDRVTCSGNNHNHKTSSVDKETATTKSSRAEEEQSETSSSQDKTILKKPDKILPCPRCNSMDTKFCYYNNYNVNQPRHFCKNCQRYWTAGGTMRNVPVGAGRRKNKSTASHYRQITVSEALQTVQANVPNGIHHPTLRPNGTILNFGSDAPLCESMTSVLSLAEKTMRNDTRNRFHKSEEQRISVSCGGGENGDENSNRSSITDSSSSDEVKRVGLQEPVMQNCHAFPPQMPCFPGAPWPYPWNSPQWTSAVPPPGFCPSNFPMSFYPAATYWGCPVPPGAWSVPWVSPPSSSPNPGTPRSGPNTPNLGKHSREGQLKPSNSEKKDQPKPSNSEGGIWIPKTLRIDDPGEAAKSSIWSTLGIKNDKSDSMSGGGLFKPFQRKGDEKNHTPETSQVLQANPAALSRSINFHEIS